MYTLLIVDDEPLVCAGVKSLLDWQSFGVTSVSTASNGQAAWNFIETHHPDIVISDIKMPIMNGLELATKCREAYGDVPAFIILTIYDDFHYAREGILAGVADFLIKPELEESSLAASVNRAISIVNQHRALVAPEEKTFESSELTEKFFIRLFNNLFESEESYLSQLSALRVNVDAARFSVAVCRCESGDAFSDNPTFVFSNAIQIARDLLEKYLKYHIVTLDLWYFAVVICLPSSLSEENQTLLTQAFEHCVRAINTYLGLPLCVSISGFVEDLRQLDLCYWQAQSASQNIVPPGPGVFLSMQSTQVPDLSLRLSQILSDVRVALEKLDPNSIAISVSELSATLLSHPDHLLEAADASRHVLQLALSLLPNGPSLLDRVFFAQVDSYRILYRYRTTSLICNWLDTLGKGCQKALAPERKSHRERVIDDVKRYIEANFTKQISLSDVAAAFNFTPNYLSHLFSGDSGENFVDYITNLRVEAAKEMLSLPDVKVFEVSEQLGFESPFYFSRVFKRCTGQSPSTYQQQRQTENK
jgi:two-component system response regulator YesN